RGFISGPFRWALAAEASGFRLRLAAKWRAYLPFPPCRGSFGRVDGCSVAAWPEVYAGRISDPVTRSEKDCLVSGWSARGRGTGWAGACPACTAEDVEP